MHSKAKGNVGEMAVAKDLMLKGYSVFSELGDLSNVDLVAIRGNEFKRIQVKTKWNTDDGTINANLRSTGPGYDYRYSSIDVDVIAAYAADRDHIVYVSVVDIEDAGNRGFAIRFDPPKNNQTKGVRLAEHYTDF